MANILKSKFEYNRFLDRFDNIHIMKWIIIFLLLFSSCMSKKNETGNLKAESDWYSLRNSLYDITDLSKFSDTSYFVCRITISQFNNFTVFETEEFYDSNMFLKIKTPVHWPNLPDDFLKMEKISFAFNQGSYLFHADTMDIILKGFKKHQTNKIISNINCNYCLDPFKWHLEIYDHGAYSSFTTDRLDSSDRIFTKFLVSIYKDKFLPIDTNSLDPIKYFQ